MANIPAAITCTDVMAKEHPELVVTFLKGMIKVGRWANEHKHAAAAILDKQTFYLDVEDTYEGIKHIDMVPNLSPQNLASVEIGKDFMKSHGYIKNDFDVQKWAAPEFLEQAAKELLEERWKKVTGDKLPTLSRGTDRVGGLHVWTPARTHFPGRRCFVSRRIHEGRWHNADAAVRIPQAGRSRGARLSGARRACFSAGAWR